MTFLPYIRKPAKAVWQRITSRWINNRAKTSAECWLRSGASHHTCMTTSVGREAWEDFARIAGVELATIDANTKAAEFERDLEISEMYHRLNNRH